MFSLSNRSLSVLETVDRRLQNVIKRAIKISLVDFGIPSSGGFRTAFEQNTLYLTGASNADGYDDLSYHQSGKAIDIFAYVGGRYSRDRSHLSMVACAILQAASIEGIEIEWGGLWRSRKKIIESDIEYGWDMAHFQIKKG